MAEKLKKHCIIKDPKNKWLYWFLGMINIYPENAKFATQNVDEEIVIILRKHISKNFSWVITSIFLFLLPIIVVGIFGLYDHNVNGDALLNSDFIKNINPSYYFGVLLFLYSFIVTYIYFNFIHWYFDLFIITNERYISIDFNILKGRMITDIPLTDIIDISEKVFGFFPTIIGYGDIEFKTTSEKISIIEKAPQTVWIRDALSDLIRYIRRIKVIKSKGGDQAGIIINRARENESHINKEKMTALAGEVMAEQRKNNVRNNKKNNILEP